MSRRWMPILALALWAAVAYPAAGQDRLAQAKQAGLVGEKPDGLAGVVAGASADVQALVDRINAERLQRYKQVARENGTSVDKVMAVAGARLIERTPAGQYVMAPSGRWVKK
ncbi:MAG TPA: YdbL family protein [Azospirillaceae bacterium]|nr:YdbL family protein [Azospirillaceae bacterium]